MGKLQGRVAIITGAGRGMGAAIARRLAEDGAMVVPTDVDHKSALEVAKSIGEAGGSACACELDVSRPELVRQAIAFVMLGCKRVDILVNNAGICERVRAEQITEEAWDRMFAVNLKGAFFCAQAVMGPMRAQGWGRIINIASVGGRTGGAGVGAHYAASKAGLICLTKSLARELAPHGITVNGVAPGVIETHMTGAASEETQEHYRRSIPLGRFGTPRDVAHAVAFFASEEASYITGKILDVDGGMVM